MTGLNKLTTLCRGTSDDIVEGVRDGKGWMGYCLTVIVLGSGLYGATIGLWRSPLQALYTGIKLPLLMLVTTAANGILNGMLAQLIGAGLGFRQAARAVTTSFALLSLILASLSPVTLFLWLNTPPLAAGGAVLSHNFTLLSHVFIIAFAGVTSNVRLLWLLDRLTGSRAVARRILAAWLAGNMFLGCQVSWLMRPFIGSPGLAVEFFRDDAFQGTFYESTYHAFTNLLTPHRERSTP
jgi:hypothetical protein